MKNITLKDNWYCDENNNQLDSNLYTGEIKETKI